VATTKEHKHDVQTPNGTTRWDFERCVDEVRIMVSVLATLNGSTDKVQGSVSMTLLEGASCATEDVDGQLLNQSFQLKGRGQTTNFPGGSGFLVRNIAEYDILSTPLSKMDFATMTVTMTE
jgi:hypothetical protein